MLQFWGAKASAPPNLLHISQASTDMKHSLDGPTGAQLPAPNLISSFP